MAAAGHAGRPPLAVRLCSGVGRELLTFAAIGVVSTAAYALLFLVIRDVTDAATANAAALVITAVGNTAANRRLTFGVYGTGRAAMVRDQVGGLAALAVALAITTASVRVLGAVVPDAGRLAELSILVAANVLSTVVRFLVLRTWIRVDRRRVPDTAPSPEPNWSPS
jgi:putative flippase GtrA